MRDWVDTTAARIRSLWKVPGRRPRMLELGCSSGPLLFRLAAHAETYHATDMSRAAVETLSRECNTMGFSHVTLAQREANDFKKLGMSAYDVIVLNSVVQYFPSIDYLVDVLEKASRALRPGGSLFVGNVRSLPLLELFHTSAELAKAPSSRTVAQLKRRVRHAVAAENELVVDPAFFWELGRLLPRLASLVCERVLCQRTRSRDEASQFRYDVVLRHRAIDTLQPSVDAFEWRAPSVPAAEILQGVRQRLDEQRWPMLTLTHARDARLASELRAFELSNEAEENCTVGDLRKALTDREAPTSSALEPDDLFLIGNEFGYDVDVLACGDAPGYFDVRFLRRSAPAQGGRDVEVRPERTSFAPPPATVERPIDHYATKPHREVQPVSAMQSYMLERLEAKPEPGLYTSFDVVPMPASVDSATLERSWQSLVDQHAALRTSFVKALSGSYRQVVHEQAKVRLEEHDWRHHPPLEVDRQLEAYIDGFRARPFELDEYPPVRLALFRTRARSWVFLGFNHLALDGASTMLLREQWLEVYKAHSNGRPVQVVGSAPLVRPPSDVASTEAFWRRELQGFRRPMTLAANMGGRRTATGEAPQGERSYAKQHVYLDREVSERLAMLSRVEGLSLNTLVHGAWALLLTEYTDRHDVLFGTMISRRTSNGMAGEGMVGALDDVLPVRPPALSRFLSLRDWLGALRDGMAKLPRHGHASLSDVKRWSELPEEARLFESYVVVENRPIDENTSESLDPATPFSLAQLDFPLRVEAWPGPRLLLILQYHRGHFRDAVVEKMLRDLERVLWFLSHGLDRPPRG